MKKNDAIKTFLDFVRNAKFMFNEQFGKEDFNAMAFAKNIECLPNQYLYIIDYIKGGITFSKGTLACLGYDADKFDIETVTKYIHPDDIDVVVALACMAVDCVNKNPLPPKTFDTFNTLDYRVRKKDGSYIRILRNTTVIEVDNEGRLTHTISMCNDITNLKHSNDITYLYNGPVAEEIMKNANDIIGKNKLLTTRELEVLKLLSDGIKTKEIAEMLFLSVNTIRNHRQNIMEKLKVKNAAELTLHAYQLGLIKL